ncbi:cytosine permease [Rhizobium phaseoli]|uniref:cytosine permease n=1 Tax=Rhizobium phaseoli TaxID=396 RepID=UPI000BE95884|nr:cytosine permease [Rhizobium phaseoli]PDS28336.1 hypothetical protein CO650_26745 [Rhizobium phaseoli]
MTTLSGQDVAVGASTNEASDKNAWPMLASERTWGSWQLGIALATAAAATWCYIIGEYAGYYLNFWQGFAALTAGSMIGMFLVAISVVPTCLKFGVDSIAASKPQFGTRGWTLPLALQFVSIIGWNSLLLIFFSKSLIQLLIATNVISTDSAAHLGPISTVVACGLVFLLLLGGSSSIDRVSKFLVAHVLVGFWMLYIVVSERWPEIVSAVPQAASPDHFYNFSTGMEIGLTSILGWWPYIGAMVRMSRSGRTAAAPIMIGMGLVVPLLCLIGIAGILALKVADPAEWLRTVGGPAYGIIALLFVTAANFGTAIAGVYASAIGLRHFPSLARISWPSLLAITIAPVALVGFFIPELFFSNFGTFLAFVGICFAPLCGIQIVDYYVLRGGNISIRGLFDGSDMAAYRFWHGFNPASLLAMAVGVGTYVYLLNPLTYESATPYQYLTASIPTVIVAGAVHWLVSVLVIIPRNMGSYK